MSRRSNPSHWLTCMIFIDVLSPMVLTYTLDLRGVGRGRRRRVSQSAPIEVHDLFGRVIIDLHILIHSRGLRWASGAAGATGAQQSLGSARSAGLRARVFGQPALSGGRCGRDGASAAANGCADAAAGRAMLGKNVFCGSRRPEQKSGVRARDPATVGARTSPCQGGI